MSRAHMPSSHRLPYMSDEAARQQDAALRAHDAVAEDYAIGSLLAWLGVVALSCAAALVRIVSEMVS